MSTARQFTQASLFSQNVALGGVRFPPYARSHDARSRAHPSAVAKISPVRESSRLKKIEAPRRCPARLATETFGK
jgi:hypothetical protein